MDPEVGLGLLADFTRLQEQIDNLKAAADSPDDVATGEHALMLDAAAAICCSVTQWGIDRLDEATLTIQSRLPCRLVSE